MKSLKLYFSLLLSAVMLAVAVPTMAQDIDAMPTTGTEVATVEAVDIYVQPVAIENAVADEAMTETDQPAAVAHQGSEGRDNTDIDKNFSPKAAIENFVYQSALTGDEEHPGFAMEGGWKYAVMLLISFVLLYLAIVKKFEPLLLMPIAFGMLLTNLPGAGMFHADFFANGHVHWENFALGSAGLLDYLYLGVKLGIYPCLIFVGVGAMTDFGPLIANPKSLLLGLCSTDWYLRYVPWCLGSRLQLLGGWFYRYHRWR